LHRTIKAVTEDMEGLRFNTAIARYFELNNELVALERVPREVAEAFVRMLAPIAPHVAEELWERLGGPYSVHNQPWPEWDEEEAAEETVTLVVQVDGRVRDRLELAAGSGEEAARRLALASLAVQRALAGRLPARVVYVPGRLLNVVSG
jgi:leucyl-tRNA synthetase